MHVPGLLLRMPFIFFKKLLLVFACPGFKSKHDNIFFSDDYQRYPLTLLKQNNRLHYLVWRPGCGSCSSKWFLSFEHNFVFPVFQRHANMFESGPFERYNYNFKWTISIFWCLDMLWEAGWGNGCSPSKQI